ncbi:MAG: MASE4 domain-containing protein, partial [Alphaproteobacteria bacterium]|nr:MASE4 domain-containing protein [Alphaproteobacteria bacterium]
TAVLLYAQCATLRSRGLLALSAGYVFTGAMAVVHGLTFPGLFAPEGLLGAGAQTTAWLYMFWHAGFPALTIVYALLKDRSGADRLRGSPARTIAASLLGVAAAVAAVTLLATAGQDALPAIMRGNGYTPAMIGVVASVWSVSLVALAVLWRRRPHSVLDLWLMVVMAAWLFDIALAAVLNQGRFDLGFYAGRIYGLMAASFVLVTLLLQTGALYSQLTRLFAIERRQAAAEIAAAHAKLATVLDSSPLPIFSLAANGRVGSWSRAAEAVFGYGADEAMRRTLGDLSGEAVPEFAQLHETVMAGEAVRDRQLRWRHRDGHVLDIVVSGAPISDSGWRIGAVYVAEDVTLKRKVERQMAQSQKMDAIGQLTGGIAHDFNNLLGVVIGNLDLMREGFGDPRQGHEDAEQLSADALNAAMRGAELVRRLLAVSRRQALQPRSLEAGATLRELEPLLKRTLGEHIVIETRVGDGIWPVLADPSELESAVLNLSINARDAMPDGGVVTLACANATLDPAAASVAGVGAGDYVALTVSDTGSGIAPDVLPRVFEPFFTTKESKGNGLGLSMVYGFARQSGGAVTIYSEVGRGTDVRIYLPRAGAPAASREVDVKADALAAKNAERILVIEDKEDVRKLAVVMLESLGYRTAAADNAESALALLDRGAPFDLVFTDIVMPGGMTGVDLAREARRRMPDVAIVFTSGFANPQAKLGHPAGFGATVLGKPYRKADLAQHVRAALDRRSAAKA